jgi:F-type H+-transporting ATPase subunit b
MEVLTQALTSLGFDWQIALANLVNFLIIFFILKHFFFESIQKAISERKAKIEKGIEDAKQAALLLSHSEKEKEQILKQAAISADEIVVAGEQKAVKIATDIQTKAEQEAQQIVAKAHKKQAELNAANDKELEKVIPELAARMVEKILKEKMTKEENEKYINTVLSR